MLFPRSHTKVTRVLVQNTTFKIIFFIKNTNFRKFIFKGKILVGEWTVTFTHCQWHATRMCQIQASQYHIGDYFSLTKGMKYFGTVKYRCTVSELPLFLNKKKLYNYNINESNSIYIIWMFINLIFGKNPYNMLCIFRNDNSN